MSKITCTKCKRQKPATLEFFGARPTKRNGLTSQCRECQRLIEKRRPARCRRKPEAVAREAARKALTAQGLQKCTRCTKTKLLADFPPEPRMHSGRSSWCLDCVRKRAKERQAARRNDPKKRIKLLQEKHRYQTSEQGRRQKRISNETYNHRRRQRLLSNAWDWSPSQWLRCKQAWSNKCAYCGEKKTLTQDHYIPISHPEYPGTTPQNMLPACSRCNCAKGSLHPHAWITDPTIRHRIETYFDGLQ